LGGNAKKHQKGSRENKMRKRRKLRKGTAATQLPQWATTSVWCCEALWEKFMVYL
jgi:hypothetical protein